MPTSIVPGTKKMTPRGILRFQRRKILLEEYKKPVHSLSTLAERWNLSVPGTFYYFRRNFPELYYAYINPALPPESVLERIRVSAEERLRRINILIQIEDGALTRKEAAAQLGITWIALYLWGKKNCPFGPRDALKEYNDEMEMLKQEAEVV